MHGYTYYENSVILYKFLEFSENDAMSHFLKPLYTYSIFIVRWDTVSSLLQQFQVLRQGRLTCKHLLAVSLAQATSTEFLLINFNIFFSILIKFCSVP
jgi:hypothetical protein